MHPDPERMLAGQNVGFLKECTNLIPSITLADQATGRIYGRIKKGKIRWTDAEILENVIQDEESKAGLEAFTASFPKTITTEIQSVDATQFSSLGQWAGE